jgi:hypothetical protein
MQHCLEKSREICRKVWKVNQENETLSLENKTFFLENKGSKMKHCLEKTKEVK